jgi:hypothetical protein
MLRDTTAGQQTTARRGEHRTLRSSRADLARAAERLLLGVLPVLSVPIVLILAHPLHNFAVDFHSWYWPAGRRVLEGRSPYTTAPLQALNYPAPAALMFVPFALLPHAIADWTFSALVLASVPASLWLLDVRDWRIYGIVMFWQPVIIGYETANVSLLVLLGLAAVWRFRDRAALAGSVLAVLISVKVFVIPVAIWLLATRRLRAVLWVMAGAATLNLIGWAVLGFDQIPVYVKLLSRFAGLTERWGYSPIALALHLGAGQLLADTTGFAAAAAVVIVSLSSGGASRDRIVFSACVAACLLASPVVESHYLALMILPLALARPTLMPLWALPLLLLVTPANFPADWQRVLALGVAAAVVGASIVSAPREPSAALGRAAAA